MVVSRSSTVDKVEDTVKQHSCDKKGRAGLS